MTWGRWYWPYFLIGVSVLFLIPELIALAAGGTNTLSDYSWTELHVSGWRGAHTLAWWLSLASWGVFTVVITWHIWWRGP